MGDNVLYVNKWPWGFEPNLKWWDIIKWPSVSTDDFQAILNRSTKSASACFTVSQNEQIKYIKNVASEARVMAVSYEFDNIRSFDIENGRYFSPEESASGKNVAVIGAVIAERLFEKENPVGKQIDINGKKTNVIGVFKKEGKGGIRDNGMDEITLVPLNYGKTFINMRNRFMDATRYDQGRGGYTDPGTER